MKTRTRTWSRLAALGGTGAILMGLGLSVLLVPAQAAGTTLTVTGTGDDATPAACSGTTCATLRDAVFAANAMTTSAGSPVTIVLAPGTTTLSQGELDIGSATNLSMTITGPTSSASGATVDQATAGSGAFVTSLVANLTTNFQNLTITGGTADATSFGGGAIIGGDTGAVVSITNCVITGNSTSSSGGGGGVNLSPGGSLTITNSTISNNSTSVGAGGGVSFLSDGGHGASTLTISGSTISGNTASDAANGAPFGGGVYFKEGSGADSFSISTSVFSSNTATLSSSGGSVPAKGGGLFADGPGSVSLSTFTGNQAATSGGLGGVGGAMWHNTGAATVSDSRIVGNTASTGSALYQDTTAGTVTADNDWWGSNTGPGNTLATGSGSVPSTPHWLQLRNIPTTAALAPGGSTTLTADLLGRNTGGALASGSLNGLASFPVPAGTVFSNAVHGSLTGASTQFGNGVATATFNASSTLLGAASADAAADSQTMTASMSVTANTTTSLSSSQNPSVSGQGVQFTATLTSNTPGTTPAAPQGGTVQFKDGGVNLGAAVAVSNGVATTPTISNLSVGAHSITADYSGDADFNASTGTLSGGQTVNKADSSVAVGTSLNPSTVGANVQFTATVTPVAPGTGTPGGTVQFKDNGTNLGTAQSLTGGVASLSTTSLTVGTHTITADYSGDTNFNGATGTLSPDQVVNKAATTLGLASSVNPSVSGQGITFTATVTSGVAGTITGNVQFGIDGANAGSPVAVSAGSASLPGISTLAVGTHTVTATYSGDTTYAASTGALAGGQTVNAAATSVALSSSLNPSTAGTPVSFTATVTATAPGAGAPGGTVQFVIDGSNAGAPVTLSGGVATLANVTSLSVATHPVVADYSGSTDFAASVSPTLNQVVNGFATTTTVASSVNPSVVGQPVTFTATVDSGGNGTPAGTVQFGIDGSNVGGPVTLSGGSAVSAALSNLAAGSHTVTATYGGGSGFAASSGTLAGGQTVNAASTTTALTSSLNPSALGQPVTFTATVAPVAPGTGTPTGTVQFFVDGSSFGTPVTLSGGAAISGAVSTLAVGTHPVTATYAGNADFSASTSATLSQVVGRVAAVEAVTSTATPSVVGQPVQFVATLTGTQGTPTGTVQFGVDGVNLGAPATLSGGVATSTAVSTLAVGTHNVTATFSGDATYTPGSAATVQSVAAAGTTTSVTSSQNPSVASQPVHFTATVAVTAPGAGTPAGQVQFVVDGSNFGGPVTLSGGSATSGDTSSLSVGNHSVTADYLGSTSFGASSGTLASGQTVGAATSTVSVTSSQNPSVFGQAVHFTATVAPIAPAGGTPDGSVQFVVDGSNFGGPVTLSGGSATSGDTSSLSVGNHSVTAIYGGSGSFSGASGSLAGGQSVNQAATTTIVTSSLNPSVSGNAVSFTATVAPVAPGAGTPDGTVQFVVDGTNSGAPVTLVGGVATLSTSSLAVGTHMVTANYSGSTGFAGSSGTLAGGQVVASAAMADIQVRKLGPGQGIVGMPLVYTILVTDAGPNTATGVQLTDTLPAGFTVIRVLPSRGTCTTELPTVTCALGTINAHVTVPVVIIAVPHARGTFTNVATASATQTDPSPANNTSRVTTYVHNVTYWLLGADGGIFTYGDGQFFGSTGGMRLNRPIVGMAQTPDGQGYWLVGSDGGVFAFGDATYLGSVADLHLNRPIVGMAATPDGQGYWLVGSDGGVFAFGDAAPFGSMAGMHLNAPVVGMSATPDGQGYWLVSSDGGVYAFGDAGHFGSAADLHPSAPIVGMAATADGQGYWLVGSDGGVYAFGDAASFGSMAGMHLNAPVVGIAGTQDGQGYWLVGADGGVYAFGDAQFAGSAGSLRLAKPVIGLAL